MSEPLKSYNAGRKFRHFQLDHGVKYDEKKSKWSQFVSHGSQRAKSSPRFQFSEEKFENRTARIELKHDPATSWVSRQIFSFYFDVLYSWKIRAILHKNWSTSFTTRSVSYIARGDIIKKRIFRFKTHFRDRFRDRKCEERRLK